MIEIGGEVGHPGMYEITSATPLNADLDPDSVELKTLEVGHVINVELLSNFEGFIRGKTEGGWFSLRDDVFQEFAKPAIHVITMFLKRRFSDLEKILTIYFRILIEIIPQ